MSTLLTALAIPGAKATLDVAHATAGAVARPFAAALEAATGGIGPTSAGELDFSDEKEADALDELSVALQELLERGGAFPGDQFRFIVTEDGTLTVEGSSLAVASIQRALDENPDLTAQIEELLAGGLAQDEAPAALVVETPPRGEAATMSLS